jgi:phenylalanyl-tRNA synthetase beta chain
MRVSLEWLREYVRFDVTAEMLAERLSSVGLPVERIERLGDDRVLEIELTANRPDCMSMLGIAREVSLLLDRPLHTPTPSPVEHPPAAADRITIEVADAQGCPRFTARVVEGVRVGPSPAWVRRRLDASGIRAINNVVDATNYVMLELGQPMHAFDYARLIGRRLLIRRARPGEGLTTLDGANRTLDAEALVVADGARAVALAGIIGGSDTEIGPATATVLLEAAYWQPSTIGRTARRLGIRTDASARFERGMDPAAPPRAQDRAAQFLAEWSGGRVLRGIVDVYPRPLERRVIRLRPERAVAVLGVDISSAEIARILRALGCEVHEGRPAWAVHAPSFRPDLTGEEDLIEEVARIYGYERIPPTLPRGETTPAVVAATLVADARVREALVGCGLTEVLTLALVPLEMAAAGGIIPVRVQNPLTIDQAMLRTTLIPGLVEILAANAARRQDDVQVFELGRVFAGAAGGTRPLERRMLGIAGMGRWRTGWNVPPDQALVDFYHLKGILETLLRALGVSHGRFSPRQDEGAYPYARPAWWHPGRVADLVVGGATVARLGELHPEQHASRRLPHRVYLAEVDLDALLPAAVFVQTLVEIPRYPAVERDIAMVSPAGWPAGSVQDAIRAAAGPLLEEVELFDAYAGPPVPPGHRSLAYHLRLRAPDRTLTAEEAEEVVQRIRIALQEQGGAQIRE